MDIPAWLTEGRVLERDDGAEVRIHRIRNGWVYYVRWMPGENFGDPRRMPIDQFVNAVRNDGLRVQ